MDKFDYLMLDIENKLPFTVDVSDARLLGIKHNISLKRIVQEAAARAGLRIEQLSEEGVAHAHESSVSVLEPHPYEIFASLRSTGYISARQTGETFELGLHSKVLFDHNRILSYLEEVINKGYSIRTSGFDKKA